VRILTLTQPWATLVAIGAKRVETRSWTTNYRGDLGIHAAVGFPKAARALCLEEPFRSWLKEAGVTKPTDLPCGEILCVARLQDVVPAENVLSWINDDERAFGDYSAGRFAWVFGARAIPLESPIRSKGGLGLRRPTSEAAAQLRSQGYDAWSKDDEEAGNVIDLMARLQDSLKKRRN
jgi:hypothetical protein